MVYLFIHGWEIVPIWFKIIFIFSVLNAAWDICMKVITRIVTFYFAKELVKEKLKFLISKRDLIRDCMIEYGWKCYEKDKVRYYESGLVKMTEMELFKNIMRNNCASDPSEVTTSIDSANNSTNTK